MPSFDEVRRASTGNIDQTQHQQNVDNKPSNGKFRARGNSLPVNKSDKKYTVKTPNRRSIENDPTVNNELIVRKTRGDAGQPVRRTVRVRLPPIQYKHTLPGAKVSDARAGFRECIKCLVGGVCAVGGAIGGAVVGAVGGPVGSIAGGAIGAAAGLGAGYVLADRLIHCFCSKGDEARYQARVQGHHNTNDAVRSLIREGKLTQSLANNWSQLSNKQMRKLMSIDSTKVQSSQKAQEIRKRVILTAAKKGYREALQSKKSAEDSAASVAQERANTGLRWQESQNSIRNARRQIQNFFPGKPGFQTLKGSDGVQLTNEQQQFFREQLFRKIQIKRLEYHDVIPTDVVKRQAEKVLAQIAGSDYVDVKQAHDRMSAATTHFLQTLGDDQTTDQELCQALRSATQTGKTVADTDGLVGGPGTADHMEIMKGHCLKAVAHMNPNEARTLYKRMVRPGGQIQRLYESIAKMDNGGGDDNDVDTFAKQYALRSMQNMLVATLRALAEKGDVTTALTDIQDLAESAQVDPASYAGVNQFVGLPNVNGRGDLEQQLDAAAGTYVDNFTDHERQQFRTHDASISIMSAASTS